MGQTLNSNTHANLCITRAMKQHYNLMFPRKLHVNIHIQHFHTQEKFHQGIKQTNKRVNIAIINVMINNIRAINQTGIGNLSFL